MSRLRPLALACLVAALPAALAGQTIAIEDVEVVEGDAGTVDAVFQLEVTFGAPLGTGPTRGGVSVEFRTRDGSARVADGDYDFTQGVVVFDPSGFTATITVPVRGDLEVEGDEEFFVDLFNPIGATLPDPEGRALIKDDDVATLSIGDVELAEGDAGVSNADFTVVLSQPVPFSVTVGFATRDGSATVADGDYDAAAGQVVLNPGQVMSTISVPVRGDLKVEGDEDFFVDLLNPDGAALDDDEGHGIIRNDDQANLSIDDVALAEGDTALSEAVFTVSLSPAVQFAVTVDFATRDGTATAASGDYRPASGQLQFAPGQTQRTLTVRLHGDIQVEADETIFVDLSNSDGAGLADAEGQGTILNDDGTALFIDDTAVTEGDAGTTEAVFRVFLSAPSDTPVGVDFATGDGSATAVSGDYVPSSGRLTFAPGSTREEIRVAVRGDILPESDETLFVELSAASGASIGDRRGQATIFDDDAESTLILPDLPPVRERAGTAFINFARVGSAKGAAGVTVDALSGSALAGEDFTAVSRRLTWSDGEGGGRVFRVPILDDLLREGDETIRIRLSDPSGITLGIPSEFDLVILDDDLAATLEPLGEGVVEAEVGQEIELQVRVTREDGAPVNGAAVVWSVEGDAELTGGGETFSDAEGVASNGVRLGPAPGQVRATAALVDSESEFTFTITAVGDLNALFDAAANPLEAAVAQVLNLACQDPVAAFREACAYLFGLGDADQRRLIEELTPRDVAAQGRITLELLQVRLRNLFGRLSAIRAAGGNANGGQIALTLRGLPVPLGNILAAFSRRESAEERFVRRIDAALAVAQEEAESAPAPVMDTELDAPGRWAFFVNGRISVGDRPGTGREEGFDLDSAALTAGADYRVNDRFVFGGALGYLDVATDLAGGGGVDTRGISLAAYGTYFKQGFYLDWIVDYGWTDFDATRRIDLPRPLAGQSQLLARGEPGGSQVSLGLGAGYEAAKGAATIGTFGRLSYIDASIDAYRERGAAPFDLAVGAQDVESLLGEAGIELSYASSRSWGVLQPMVRLSYLHEFEDDARLIRGRFVEDVDANEFALASDAADRDFFNLSVGLSATLARGRGLYLLYDTDLDRDDLSLDTLSAGLRLEF